MGVTSILIDSEQGESSHRKYLYINCTKLQCGNINIRLFYASVVLNRQLYTFLPNTVSGQSTNVAQNKIHCCALLLSLLHATVK